MAGSRWLLLTLLAQSLGRPLPPPGTSPTTQRCAWLGLRGGGDGAERGPELFINSYTDAVYAKMRDDTVRTEAYRTAIKALAPNRTVRATLEATQGQNDSFFSQLPYKCYLEEWEIDLRIATGLPPGWGYAVLRG